METQQQMIDLRVLLKLEKDDYNTFKSEVKMYYERYKGKKFMIYTIDYDALQLAYECIYKIKPILNFIVIRNMNETSVKISSELLKFINNLEIEYYVKRISSTNEYGKCIVEKKLFNIINNYNNEIRYLISFMFNVQPIGDRKVSQNVVGFGKDEFDIVE